MLNKFLCVVVPTLLAACGGTSIGGVETPAPFAAKLASFERQNDTIRALSPTGVAGLPTSERVAFEGRALITAETADDSLQYVIVGDSRIDINFSNNFVSGNVTNMTGERTDSADNVSYHAITGYTELGEDDIAARYTLPSGENGFLGSHNFVLDTPDGDLLMSGVLEGRYFGNAVNVPAGGSAIRGVTMESVFDANDTLNGQAVETSVLITGYPVR